MDISKQNFFSCSSKMGMSKEQMEALWTSLEKTSQDGSKPLFFKILYYVGTLIVIGAMTLFMDLVWERFAGGGIFLIAVLYAVILTTCGAILWKKKEFKTPAGLLITIAVCMAPVAIYGLCLYFDPSYEDYVSSYTWHVTYRIFMEIGTILAGITALKFFSFPFLTVPIYFSAWLLCLDIIALNKGNTYSVQLENWVLLFYGILLMGVGYLLDRTRGKNGFGFWSYLSGTASFWIGLTGLIWFQYEGQSIMAFYLLINVVMLFLSVLLQRKVLAVFGSFGIFCYLSYLAYEVFQDSLWFPFMLSFLGLFIIFCAVLYQKNATRIEKKIFQSLPQSIKKHLTFHSDKS